MNNQSLLVNNVPGSASGKLTIIDQNTYEQFHQESKTLHRIKNMKYKKSHQVLNLAQFIKSKQKLKKPIKRTVYAIYKKGKTPLRKCKRRCSKLKKSILKHRQSKGSVVKEEKEPNLVAEGQTEDVIECLKNLTLEIHPKKSSVHSRRFREYCDNTTSQELCNLVETLLRELHRFQKRAFESKGRCRRRIVIGFREVQVQMKINKVKFVVIATDCEKCDLEDGLDQTIMSIKEDCRSRIIPCAFALQRRQLSYALFKKSPVSCVGVLDYDGVQEIFFKLLNILELEKLNYKSLFNKIEL